jgi:hypothetical protein
VYTPALVVQGREWRGWVCNSGFGVAPGPDVGRLELVALDRNRAQVRFTPTTAISDSLTVNVAVLGFDPEPDVTQGENTGRILHHDFVVLATATAPLRRDGDGYVTGITIPPTEQQTERLGLAAWISTGADPAPLHAVGGWLSREPQ